MRKLGKILFCFVPFLITLGLQFLVTIPAIGVYLVRLLHSGGLGNLTYFMERILSAASDSSFTLTVTVVYAIVNLVLFLIWYRILLNKSDRRDRRRWRQKPFSVIKAIIPALVLSLGLYYLTNYLVLFLSNVRPAWLDAYSSIMENIGYGDSFGVSIGTSVLLLIYSLVIAPLSEELVFRGVTLTLAKKQMPFFAANILQAALFGVLHLNPLQGCYAFVIGLFLGYVAHNRNTIKASVLLHICFNFIGSVCAAYLPSYDGSAVYIHMLILAAGIIVTALGLLWLCRPAE